MKDNKALGFTKCIRKEIEQMVAGNIINSDYGCELDQMLDVIKQALTKEVDTPTLPNFTDIDIEKLWEIEDEVTVKENWKELIKVISKIKQALSVPTKSAKEIHFNGSQYFCPHDNCGVVLTKKVHIPIIERYGKSHCPICGGAITQQLKELEE